MLTEMYPWTSYVNTCKLLFLKMAYFIMDIFLCNFFLNLFFGCVGSQLQHAGSFVVAYGLFIAALGLLSSCGVQVFSLQFWRVGSRVHGLHGTWTQQFWRVGLVAPRHVGSQFPDQGSNPRPLHWKADSLPLDHQLEVPLL